jgi:predicted amidophosphoribosyltransferase
MVDCDKPLAHGPHDVLTGSVCKTCEAERKSKPKCPDCGNASMDDGGERFHVFTGQYRDVLKCSQCRRWVWKKELMEGSK